MIAFLCTSMPAGREALAGTAAFSHCYVDSRGWLSTGKDGTVPIGFLASKINHLRGKEIAGYVLLDDAPADLVSYATSRLRRTISSPRWQSQDRDGGRQ
ncbi:MAG: hypothetical protein VX072_06930 [Pseudomonadota bacterium]|nr:hypothetical protein [Pseudomonadota bacterium]